MGGRETQGSFWQRSRRFAWTVLKCARLFIQACIAARERKLAILNTARRSSESAALLHDGNCLRKDWHVVGLAVRE